jgi:hypothetical protein
VSHLFHDVCPPLSPRLLSSLKQTEIQFIRGFRHLAPLPAADLTFALPIASPLQKQRKLLSTSRSRGWLSVETEVTFVDEKLRKHCIELESSTAISFITAMLGSIWPVPSGFCPKLVYENRTLLKHESLDNIGCFASKFISYFWRERVGEVCSRVDFRHCLEDMS